MTERPKYTKHYISGLSLRLPPYLRQGLVTGEPWAQIQHDMISQNPHLGLRTSKDTVENNLGENIRLRRIARSASRELSEIAESWGVDRFCTIVHGSLAKGLIRHPDSGDPSDVDIDLIVDGCEIIPKEPKNAVRQHMYNLSVSDEARIDSYVFNLDQIIKNCGDYARIYLSSCAYPIANKGNLWEEILWIGLINQKYTLQEPHLKKKIRRALQLISEGKQEEQVKETIGDARLGSLAWDFLSEHDLFDPQKASRVARR